MYVIINCMAVVVCIYFKDPLLFESSDKRWPQQEEKETDGLYSTS